MPASTGAHVIALTLRDLGVTVIFGLVGIPVVDIAEVDRKELDEADDAHLAAELFRKNVSYY